MSTNRPPMMTDEPCPRCLALAKEGRIRTETVQRMPAGARAPLGLNRQKCCYDCASADSLIKTGNLGVKEYDDQTFLMARIAVGNDRQDQYRLPGSPFGLVAAGLMRPSQAGDLDAQHAWLDSHGWFGIDVASEDQP